MFFKRDVFEYAMGVATGLINTSLQTGEQIRRDVRDQIQFLIDRNNLVSKDELVETQELLQSALKKIDALEAKIETLEQKAKK